MKKAEKGNLNYRKGRRIEYKAINELKEDGHITFRSAGSHSKADVVAIDKEGIRLIQLKSVKRKSYSFKKEVEEIRAIHNLPDNASKELWIYGQRIKGVRKAGWIEKIIIK